MKFIIPVIALCVFCFAAQAQFDPYSQDTLIQLVNGTSTNTTTAAVGTTNIAVDISSYAGIASLVICVTSNYAAAAATCAVWAEGTSVSPTNVAGSIWQPVTNCFASTSASSIVTNLNTGTAMYATNTVFTPASAFTTTVATTNAPSIVVEYGIPIADCPRYIRVNFNTTGLGASYGITAILKARKRTNN